MRISLDKDDPGYNVERAMTTLVILDGVTQAYAITADEEEGFVLRLVVDQDGRPVRDATGAPVTERITGKVMFVT